MLRKYFIDLKNTIRIAKDNSINKKKNKNEKELLKYSFIFSKKSQNDYDKNKDDLFLPKIKAERLKKKITALYKKQRQKSMPIKKSHNKTKEKKRRPSKPIKPRKSSKEINNILLKKDNQSKYKNSLFKMNNPNKKQKTFKEEFKTLKLLGNGSNSNVYLCMNRLTKKYYAVKIIKRVVKTSELRNLNVTFL